MLVDKLNKLLPLKIKNSNYFFTFFLSVLMALIELVSIGSQYIIHKSYCFRYIGS